MSDAVHYHGVLAAWFIFHVPWGQYWDQLLHGLLLTIEYTAAGFAGAAVLGFLLAIARIRGGRVFGAPARVFIELFKNTPLITQIFIIYFGLSSVRIVLSVFAAGTISLIVHYGSYLSEIFRSALQAIDPGQREAGMAMGLSNRQVLRKIVVPQATRIALPGSGTMLVDLLKGTSLMVSIGGAELMTQGQIITSETFRALEVYVIIGLIYFAVCFPLSHAVAAMESWMASGKPFTRRRRRILGYAQDLVASSGETLQQA